MRAGEATVEVSRRNDSTAFWLGCYRLPLRQRTAFRSSGGSQRGSGDSVLRAVGGANGPPWSEALSRENGAFRDLWMSQYGRMGYEMRNLFGIWLDKAQQST